MENFKELPINADRICEAISKIGYNPCSAILDIVDNSIVAHSKNIEIRLYIKEGTTLNTRQNVELIQIIDDGEGMNDENIENALQLGSKANYYPKSLSKYGLGLKSAGFSLGNRIEILSKYKNQISSLKLLDREYIRSNDSFGVVTEQAPVDQIKILEHFSSGTIITIRNITYTSSFSAKKILTDLINQAGVHYCDILAKCETNIYVKVFENIQINKCLVEKEIRHKDMLFWNIANNVYEKENYDCKKPCKVLDDEFDNPLNPEGEKIKIKATIFPQDQMKTYPLFSEEEQELIKSYEIGSKNSGFYFYRNGRLIRWGEQIKLNREYGFRAKIEFSTEHDDLFGVDVSKQQLTIPEEVEQTILYLCKIPREQSAEVFEKCKKLLENSRKKEKEGTAFNIRNNTLEEDDNDSLNIDKNEANKRKQKLEEESEILISTEESKYEKEDDEESFKRVRYWDTPTNMNLWESCTDRVEGTYVLINKLHPYYNHTLSKLGTGDPERQSIEALIHSLAVGQIQTIQKFQSIDDSIVKNIFQTFLRSVSHQLDNWVSSNWDLFDDGN